MSLVLQNNEAERKAADEALQKALKLLLDDSFNPQDLLQKLRAHRDCFNSDHALGSVLITINGLNNDIAHVKKDIEAARGDLKSEGLQLAQELEQAKKNLTDFNRDNPRDAKNPLSSEKNFELHWIQATLRLAELRVEQYNEWKVPLVESRIKEQEAWLAKTEERVGQLEQVRTKQTNRIKWSLMDLRKSLVRHRACLEACPNQIVNLLLRPHQRLKFITKFSIS